MGTKMNFYHYLVETLFSRRPQVRPGEAVLAASRPRAAAGCRVGGAVEAQAEAGEPLLQRDDARRRASHEPVQLLLHRRVDGQQLRQPGAAGLVLRRSQEWCGPAAADGPTPQGMAQLGERGREVALAARQGMTPQGGWSIHTRQDRAQGPLAPAEGRLHAGVLRRRGDVETCLEGPATPPQAMTVGADGHAPGSQRLALGPQRLRLRDEWWLRAPRGRLHTPKGQKTYPFSC
jgi:hypothetical protein